ncbi:MAG: S-layer homology domain-containing protein [Oscillibacter sp.]|nr:S-layer homology domain-containing protein [Oscillibacter sp.]
MMKKSHKIRFLSLVLALVLSFSLCIPALAADGFSDVPESHWAYSDIMACAEQGIVTGYEDGTFRPEDEVSTVQFLAMMTRTFYADELSQVTTPAGQPWYYANVKAAEDVGMSKNLAAVDESPMSRYDMAMALYNTTLNFYKFITSAQGDAARSQIKDWTTIAASYKTYTSAVTNCYALGILTGMSDGTFSGDSNMNRAQACAVIVRMMNLINGSAPARPEQPTQPEQPQQPEQPEETGTGKLANGKDATTENVLEILAQIQEEYPTGTVWDEKGTDGNYYAAGNNSTDVKAVTNKFKTSNNKITSTQYACGGWAAMVSDRIFGQTGAPAREVTDPSKVRAGDILISLNGKGQLTHVSIASENAHNLSGSYVFTTCDGNSSGGYVYWNTNSYSTIGTITSNIVVKAFTRYPE